MMPMPLGTLIGHTTQSHSNLWPCTEQYMACQSFPPISLSTQEWWKAWPTWCASDGSGYLIGVFNSKTNMSIIVLNSDKSFEPGPLWPKSASALAWSLEPHPSGIFLGKIQCGGPAWWWDPLLVFIFTSMSLTALTMTTASTMTRNPPQKLPYPPNPGSRVQLQQHHLPFDAFPKKKAPNVF